MVEEGEANEDEKKKKNLKDCDVEVLIALCGGEDGAEIFQ
jgi:hypothetical protein